MGSIDLGGGLVTRVEPTLFDVAHQFSTGAGGAWSHTIPVPNQTALIGGVGALWTLFLGAQSIEATNGLRLRFGRRCRARRPGVRPDPRACDGGSFPSFESAWPPIDSPNRMLRCESEPRFPVSRCARRPCSW
jgi:hypothetical protein